MWRIKHQNASAVASGGATLYCLKGHEQRGDGTLTHYIAHSVTRGKFAGWVLVSISGEGDLTRCPGSIDLQRTSPPIKLWQSLLLRLYSTASPAIASNLILWILWCTCLSSFSKMMKDDASLMYDRSNIRLTIIFGWPGGTQLLLHHYAIMLATETAGFYQMAALCVLHSFVHKHLV